MKAISGKKFAKLLKNHGWELNRVNGSHHIFTHSENQLRISLPIHGNRPLKIGLQRHLMKIAEIEDNEL